MLKKMEVRNELLERFSDLVSEMGKKRDKIYTAGMQLNQLCNEADEQCRIIVKLAMDIICLEDK